MRTRFWGFLIAALLSIGLTACQSLRENPATAQIVIQYATGKYLENSATGKREERRAEIIRIATDIQSMSGVEGVSLTFLRERLQAELQRRQLSPSDRLAIDTLVNLAATEIEKRIADGVLNPDEVVRVQAVLQWVIDAAAIV